MNYPGSVSPNGKEFTLDTEKDEEKRAFDVRDYGAKADGVTNDAEAVQRAVDDCAAAGGGAVRLPEGSVIHGNVFRGEQKGIFIQGSVSGNSGGGSDEG
jgi:polygalacturonase